MVGETVLVIGDEQVRLCCFFGDGDGVVCAEVDGVGLYFVFVSLVERGIVS
jgi:hypothetical protein